jgi:hypothetical protein
MNTNLKALLTGLVIGIYTLPTYASLESRANGALVYDNALNITWSADANLFQTMATGNIKLIDDIISANNGVIHDTANNFDNGSYTLSSQDFTSQPSFGGVKWWAAQAFIAYLNSTNYQGYNDWRLPTTLQPDPSCSIQDGASSAGFLCTGSELGHMYYKDLGGSARSNPLISNLQSGYWSNTEFINDPSSAWMFVPGNDFFSQSGIQVNSPKTSYMYIWAVRTGDIASVPVPAAVWLFASGIMACLGFSKRRRVV